LRKA
jgi:hypothetical protein